MDASGARALRFRIEQQEHWQQAEAVREGLQPASDPDGADVRELGDGVRYYGARRDHLHRADGQLAVRYRLVKRLVSGYWKPETDAVAAAETS